MCSGSMCSPPRPLGRFKIQLERGSTRGPCGKHPLELVPVPDACTILDKFEPQSKDGVWDGHTSQHTSGNSRTKPLDRLPGKYGRRHCGRGNKGMPTPPGNPGLITFILEDLSRWSCSCPRMWLEGESEQKQFAYETLYYVMHGYRADGSIYPGISARRSTVISGAGITRRACTCSTGKPAMMRW